MKQRTEQYDQPISCNGYLQNTPSNKRKMFILFNKYKTDLNQSMFSDHNRIKPEINNRKRIVIF